MRHNKVNANRRVLTISKQIESITDDLADWMRQQHVFFVATAPLSAEGHVNSSPKGGDCFRILGPMSVAYSDLTGSGAETIAHLRENGRIVLMFCAFEGKPQIARLHGTGKAILPGNPDFDNLDELFAPNPGRRAIVRVNVERVSTSCGFSVPLMEFIQHRDTLDKWSEAKGEEALSEYRTAKNSFSIDGLPALLGK